MNYLTAKIAIKEKPLYFTAFFSMLFVCYLITISSANAAIITRLDTGMGTSQMLGGKFEDEAKVVVPTDVISRPPLQSKIIDETGSMKYIEPNWISLDPTIRSETVTFRDSSTGEEVTKAWSQLNNEEIRRLLTNKSTEIMIKKLDGSGTAGYLIANTTASAGEYIVIMDFTSYRSEDAVNDLDQRVGQAKVGVGFRLTAKIKTYKANVNLSSVGALGLAAETNKLNGTMKIETIGVTTKNDSGMMLSSTKIDEASISNTLQAIAVLQSKIVDADTHLDPQIIWVKPSSYFIEPKEVVKAVNKGWFSRKNNP